MRPISFERGYLKHPAGSCLVSFGDTKVICTCVIEGVLPPFVTTGGWLTAEYSMVSGSMKKNCMRQEILVKNDCAEGIRKLIGRSLRKAVDLEALPPVSLIVDCTVIQSDGGVWTASVSGAWVALVDALQALGKQEKRKADWLSGQVAAVSVGLVNGRELCDLNSEQENTAEVSVMVIKRDDDLAELREFSERGVFTRDQLQTLLDSAEKGIAMIMATQRETLNLT